MLMRTDPFRELDRLTQQVLGTDARPAAMPMDAYRQGDNFYICLDLPGVAADSIDLTVEQNVLTVRAERAPVKADGAELIVAERPYGTFTRQVFLGETLDAEHIAADYAAGVLTLTIPVHEAAKPRSIQVTSRDEKQAGRHRLTPGSMTGGAAGIGAARASRQPCRRRLTQIGHGQRPDHPGPPRPRARGGSAAQAPGDRAVASRRDAARARSSRAAAHGVPRQPSWSLLDG